MARRQINRLSARTVAALKEPGLHADGGGLYLRVDRPAKDEVGNPTTGPKRWVFIFQWRGKRKEMGLGSAQTFDLKDAREAALAARKLVAGGVNPIQARKDNRDIEVPTFGQVADDLIAALAPTWRNAKHGEQWTTSLVKHAAALRPLSVDAVTTDDVVDVLKPIWSTIPETASRTRGRIERVLDAAKAKGFRSGENPARWKGHLDHLLPKRQRLTQGHHPAMASVDAPAFFQALAARPAVAARALEFLILTAGRSGEVRGAIWGEIDMTLKLWTIPADRMKAGKEHRVPLSPRAVEILEGLQKTMQLVSRKGPPGSSNAPISGLVFPGQRAGRPLSDMAMEMLLRRIGVEGASVHGFRSTFRDWAGESTNFPREIIEQALAHTVGDAVERAYRRGDALEKRRKLMEAWASFLTRSSAKAAGNVHAIGRAKV